MDKIFMSSFGLAILQVIVLYIIIKLAKKNHPIIAIILFGGKIYMYYRLIEHIVFNDIANIDKYIFGFLAGLPLAAVLIFFYMSYVGLPLKTFIRKTAVFSAPYIMKFINFLKSLGLLIVYETVKLFSKKKSK